MSGIPSIGQLHNILGGVTHNVAAVTERSKEYNATKM